MNRSQLVAETLETDALRSLRTATSLTRELPNRELKSRTASRSRRIATNSGVLFTCDPPLTAIFTARYYAARSLWEGRAYPRTR
jgi:hypothetical protein